VAVTFDNYSAAALLSHDAASAAKQGRAAAPLQPNVWAGSALPLMSAAVM